MASNKKIAIVYDWIDKWGGVERILLKLHQLYPQADFYTSYVDYNKASWAKGIKFKTSFIQHLPKFIKQNRLLSFIFYPLAFESFNFNNYDLVISVTSSFAKAVITKPPTKHICILLTPTRYFWVQSDNYLTGFSQWLLKHLISWFKTWDYVVAQRPDEIISISDTVKNRCLKFYHRKSVVVYPPFDYEYWIKIKANISSQSSLKTIVSDKFFLVVSRLEQYKKVDLVIKVFNRLGYNLVIVGTGSQEAKYQAIANNNIRFLSNISDMELGQLYYQAQGLIMAQNEDFGYVSLEAQLFGCPVISLKAGGAMETVIDGATGIFFNHQNEKDLRDAIERFDQIRYNLKDNLIDYLASIEAKFSQDEFIKQINQLIK